MRVPDRRLPLVHSLGWPLRRTGPSAPSGQHTAAHRGVAQPGRAPGSGPGGRRFESSLPDHLVKAATSGLSLFAFALCHFIVNAVQRARCQRKLPDVDSSGYYPVLAIQDVYLLYLAFRKPLFTGPGTNRNVVVSIGSALPLADRGCICSKIHWWNRLAS